MDTRFRHFGTPRETKIACPEKLCELHGTVTTEAGKGKKCQENCLGISIWNQSAVSNLIAEVSEHEETLRATKENPSTACLIHPSTQHQANCKNLTS
jgi:hypothetical protein